MNHKKTAIISPPAGLKKSRRDDLMVDIKYKQFIKETDTPLFLSAVRRDIMVETNTALSPKRRRREITGPFNHKIQIHNCHQNLS